MLNTCKEMFSLMCEAAEEGLQKARIKTQQNRIRQIMRVDEGELESVYAKIGRISVTGKDKDKRDDLIAEAKRIEARILRAEVRLEMLKNAASVDECTRAFEEKLIETAQSVKKATEEKTKDIKEKAKVKSGDIKEKLKDTASDLTAKAEDLTIKAKDKAADISIKAKDTSDKAKDKAKEKAKDLKEKLPKAEKAEKEAEEKVLDNVDDILKRIEDTINSVDEESAEEFKF
ncbi:MAG: hypothetical protein IJZ54_04180 [Clostridia bacterium]|nr:hypothetical protein [Clostridia bacterium]